MNPHEPGRMDRRVAIKWMLMASAGAMATRPAYLRGAGPSARGPGAARGYGTDPDLMKRYAPGDAWPLTLTPDERRTASLLCDIMIPADERSPSASSVGVVDFIDEWVSAPYGNQVSDAKTVSEGLAWLDAEATRRFGTSFAGASDAQRLLVCEDLSHTDPADTALGPRVEFFRKFRDLTATGYYTSPIGIKDLGYVGNVPLARFDGPPADLIEKLGLSDEVAW